MGMTQTATKSLRCFLLFWIIIFVIASVGCARKTTVNVAGRLSPGWSVQLVEASEPGKAIVMSKNPMKMSVPVPIPPSDDKQKWIVVRIKVTSPPRPDDKTFWPPGVVGAVRFSEIKLVASGGDSYTPEALATGAKWKDEKGNESWEFLQPGMSGATIKDASGQQQFVVENGTLWFYETQPKEVTLLFAVPKRVESVSISL